MHHRLLMLTMSVLLLAGCHTAVEPVPTFPLGLWTGTYEEHPLSIEFRPDGRAILVYGGEDGIALAGYQYDPSVTPPALDITFDNVSSGIFQTRIERLDDQTLRLGALEEGAPRPDGFGPDAVVLHRSEEHVLPRGADSTAERDEALDAALRGDIWFGGERGATMLDICEALYRHQFEKNASAAQQNARAYYLTVADRDPPPELMDRFAEHTPPVRPGSQFHVGEGLKFRIDRIVWIDERTVEATGGYYEGGLSSSGNTYRLERRDGQWHVVEDTMNWIS